MLMIIALIIELIFKSSNIPSLVSIDLLILVIIAILQKEFSLFTLFIFLLFSIVIELFNFKTVGVTSLALFFAIFSVKILGNFIHFFSLDRRNFFSLLLLYLLFILFRLIITSILKEESSISIINIVINSTILLIFNWLISRFFNNKYVLER